MSFFQNRSLAPARGPASPNNHGASFFSLKKTLSSITNTISDLQKAAYEVTTGTKSVFDDWPVDALVRELEEEGLYIPPDFSAYDLIQFAEEYYVDGGR